MKTLFLINARSGVRRKLDISALIRDSCRELATEHELQQCPSTLEPLDGIIDDAARRGYEVIYAVGGDGTVHEIAKRVMRRNLILGIIPTGSGNGFARHLGLTAEPRELLSACHKGSVVAVDTAEVNGLPFFGVLGMGLDAEIARRFASSDVRGMRTYVQEGLRAFRGYRAQDYVMTIDGVTTRRRALVVAVANSSQYGNNARIAPIASLQDALLNVVIVDHTSMFNAPFLLARLFNGSLHRSKLVTFETGRNILIRREGPSAVHLDGEPMDMPAELNIQVKPRSLKVLVPASAHGL
jgi:diacylglycerol kinase (ATP)